MTIKHDARAKGLKTSLEKEIIFFYLSSGHHLKIKALLGIET